MEKQAEIEATVLSYVLSGVRTDIHPIPSHLFSLMPYRKIAELLSGLDDPSLSSCLSVFTDKQLEDIGGLDTLVSIYTVWEKYGLEGADVILQALRESYERSRVSDLAREVSVRAREGLPYSNTLALLQEAATPPSKTEYTMSDVMGLANRRADDVQSGVERAIPIPLGGLDEEYKMEPGHLVVIGARAKIGKTASALQLSSSLANDGIPVCFYSFEMPAYQLGLRIMSQQSNVSLQRIKFDPATTPIRLAISEKLASLGKNFMVADSIRSDEELFAHIRARARAGTVVFVVDYLGLIPPAKSAGRREQEVAYITRSLKQLAIRWGIIIILLAQINREAEKRRRDDEPDDRRPELHHLRDSGAIEADADMVILIWRQIDTDRIPTEYGEIIVAANRHGPTGVYPVKFSGSTMRFDRDIYARG